MDNHFHIQEISQWFLTNKNIRFTLEQGLVDSVELAEEDYVFLLLKYRESQFFSLK